ncbi:MAG: sensor histidine kinase [Cyclobacteriaceae bacterium]
MDNDQELNQTAAIAFKALRNLQSKNDYIRKQQVLIEQKSLELKSFQEDFQNTAAIAFNAMNALRDRNNELEVAKQELEELAEKLKISNQELEQLAYIATHDLKGPINNIEASLQLIKGKIHYDVVKEFIEYIDKSVLQAKRTLDDLSSIIRLQKQQKIAAEEVELSSILNNIKAMHEQDFSRYGIELTSNFANTPRLKFYKFGLQSILQNLVHNAIKYRSLERSPRINVWTTKSDKLVVLHVEDNGIGIDLDKHRKDLFVMFKRLHCHSEGSGMGLYIVKKLIENSGGKIEVESKVGVGTTFHIFLQEIQ